MRTYIDCWISTATVLFSQALAGEPNLVETDDPLIEPTGLTFAAELSGDVRGRFSVTLDPRITDAPLLGEGVDQTSAWSEFLREVAEAAAGELLTSSGLHCRVDALLPDRPATRATRTFSLNASGHAWTVLVHDGLQMSEGEIAPSAPAGEKSVEKHSTQPGAAVDLLLDVELEAALRFGCREMPLGEILELGPGDVVELDRHISDPVDLVVGDKIVARGDVVLVNGNFGLRVTEVAAPQMRLESIRCLF